MTAEQVRIDPLLLEIAGEGASAPRRSSTSTRPASDIARACDLARAFTDLVPNRRGQLLPAWIRQAEQSDVLPVAKFAAFLSQDFDAVTAGLTLEWSSGKVEGHVNRVKTIKRAMYGRAGFRLLRTRILAHT
ncbi:transposase [Streptomyces agglomeratus]|uniref:transposase n=1 Tax=Streptomyces agglomeratus TaxID=285458 RepID=UPI001C40193C